LQYGDRSIHIGKRSPYLRADQLHRTVSEVPRSVTLPPRSFVIFFSSTLLSLA
jgi:hypothetical protein